MLDVEVGKELGRIESCGEEFEGMELWNEVGRNEIKWEKNKIIDINE